MFRFIDIILSRQFQSAKQWDYFYQNPNQDCFLSTIGSGFLLFSIKMNLFVLFKCNFIAYIPVKNEITTTILTLVKEICYSNIFNKM